jgi:hypothetical protein
MPDEQKKILPIDYTNREFNTIRRDLYGIAERFYPDTFRDFSEGSFGAMMVDAVAYVSDQLSFYLDYNVNESFLDTAYQYDNILRHGRIMGYKYTGPNSSYGKVAIYILIPASQTGLGPDRRYIPVMKRGSTFSAQNGTQFTLTKNIDFAEPSNSIIVARTNATTGAPTFYAIKAYGEVVSGFFSSERVSVGAYQRFRSIGLRNPNISEIISIFDTEGNEYFEVDYLAQDMVYREVPNKNFKNDNVPSVLKPLLVSRKFVVNRTADTTIIQFGSGESASSEVVADPASVATDIFGKDYVTDTTFDPTRLSKNQSYGIVPTNTELIIRYRANNSQSNNIATAGINRVTSAVLEFENEQSLDSSQIDTIRGSLECSNEEPIVGNVNNNTSDEIKRKIYDTFPTQNRAVTQADYENIAYRMPAKFGSIKRVSVQRDPSSERRNLNMYVISEDNFGKMIVTNSTIKNNLKTWINHYRMLSDTVDIIDAFIINFGVDFVVRPSSNVDKYELLRECVSALQDYLSTSYFIGEHVNIANLYKRLSEVKGVLDVVSVKITNKNGGNYSSVQFNINENTSPDGTYVVIPKNAIAELKFPTSDIRGKIR